VTTTPTSKITNYDELIKYLKAALVLEHATIPPYLTALYSLRAGSNSPAWHILRVVAVEEMLHLTLVANVMNAVRCAPNLTYPEFVPDYPTALPSGEDDFVVDLQPFSAEAVETALMIERPGKAPEGKRLIRRDRDPQAPALLVADPLGSGLGYWSIGEFYEEIIRGLKFLAAGTELFTGNHNHQVLPEYFYSGGGSAIPVTDLNSALEALSLIAEQGEGLGGGIFDGAGELAHYYRFEQLKLGRYYQKGDSPGDPSGQEFTIDWDATYPVMTNAKLANYPADSELFAAARHFNQGYAGFLAFLTEAFNGKPELLLDAVPWMFRIRDDMERLIKNPVPGRPGVHAGPTFEVAEFERGTS
jgi:ferritin-like protein